MNKFLHIISRSQAKKKGLKAFYTGKRCKRGHCSTRSTSEGKCRECKAIHLSRYYKANKERCDERKKVWYLNNKDYVKAQNKLSYERDGDSRREYAINYHLKNKEKIKIYRSTRREEIAHNKKKYNEKNKNVLIAKRKIYSENNKDKIEAAGLEWRSKNRKKQCEYRKKYYIENKSAISAKARIKNKLNPVNTFIRDSLRRIIANWKGGRAKYETILGYTHNQLERHLEKQFVKGMNWKNRSEWHIDHIIPVSHYIKEGVTDPAIINCLSNLRPIWAKDNMSKGASITHLL